MSLIDLNILQFNEIILTPHFTSVEILILNKKAKRFKLLNFSQINNLEFFK